MSKWLCNLPFQSGSPSGISESLQSARIQGGFTTCRTTVNARGAWGGVAADRVQRAPFSHARQCRDHEWIAAPKVADDRVIL